MLFTLTLIFTLAAFAADWIHLRHQRRRGTPALRSFIIWALATDALPLVSAIVGWICRDNGPGVMNLYMWLFWAWIVTVLPRMLYYVFHFLKLPRAGLLTASLLTLYLLWGTTFGRTRIHVNRVEIRSDRIPAAFDGFRIAQFSDAHVGTLVRPQRELTRLTDTINALQPDAVFFTGDLVNIRSAELDDRTMALLQRIEAPVWSVTGNHDVGTYIRDSVRYPAAVEARKVIERQQAMGWCVLEDTTAYLRRGTDSISLTGISFDPALRERRHDRHLPAPQLPAAYAGIPETCYNITLVHVPQLWEQIIATGHGDLTLAGHVHAMQMKIRPWGRGCSPASWLYPRWSGRYDMGRHTLYIDDGTGYVAYPMRLGAWPEITLFTLKRCA